MIKLDILNFMIIAVIAVIAVYAWNYGVKSMGWTSLAA
jgi:hypothetical protein